MKNIEYKNLVRLFVSRETIFAEENHLLSETQAHYLKNVMKLQENDLLRIFNAKDGEWVSKIKKINKKNIEIEFLKQINEQKSSSDVWVICSPVKKENFDIIVEKSTELGASKLIPVICAHTVIHRINQERLQAVSIEASEQSERLDLMTVEPLTELKSIFQNWPKERKLLFCEERGNAQPIAQALKSMKNNEPLAVLVGPEGGFSDQEKEFIRKHPFVASVSLGERILRAETAVIAALSCVEALRG